VLPKLLTANLAAVDPHGSFTTSLAYWATSRGKSCGRQIAAQRVAGGPFDRLNPTDYSRDMGTSGTIGDRSGWSQNDQAADALGQSGALEAGDRAEIRAERDSRGQNRVMRVRPVSLGERDRRELG
jgi:hypothetical protein